VVPFDHTDVWDEWIYDIKYENHVLMRKSRQYKDHAFNPSEFLYMADAQVFSMRDFLTNVGQSFPFETISGNCPFLEAWFVVIKGMDYSGGDRQFFKTFQTAFVKDISNELRRVFQLDDSDLHQIRRKVFLQVATAKCGVIGDNRVTGWLEYEGRGIYVAIAGHMVNTLIASSYTTIDFRRYLRTIEYNVRSTMREQSGKASRAEDQPQGERSVNALWHGFFDWFYATDVYREMCKIYRLSFNSEAFDFVRKELLVIKRKLPTFVQREGFQATGYRGIHGPPEGTH
jgi:hypothetical protein